MTVEKLIEFLQTLPTDTKVVKLSNDKNCIYREVAFNYTQVINADGTIAKRLEVK